MQPDNKHTDNKLKELENQSLPDLSKMDEHWQQMKMTLQPGSSAPEIKRTLTKKYWRVAAAIVISGLFLIIYTLTRQTESTVRADGKLAQQPNRSAIPASDTIPSVLLKNEKDTISSIKETPTKQRPGPVLRRKTVVGYDHDTVIQSPAIDKHDTNLNASLAIFFKQLEKQPQEFVINTESDTLLSGDDGTALLIPANTFDSKEDVLISMKEFYSYEDIITNQLTTCSDGKQLITGGMIHINATVNGKEVDIQPGKSIRWFVPDTTAMIQDMQLFTGSVSSINSLSEEIIGRDTVITRGSNSINWIAQSQAFSRDFITTKVKVLDLRDLPYKTITTGRKYKAFYILNSNSQLTKDELKLALQKKYPHYNKIIIPKTAKKKTWDTWSVVLFSNRESQKTTYTSIGDSAWIDPREAKLYKLPATDTITFTNSSSVAKNSLTNTQLKKLSEKYSVNIQSLGWINCDRFYNDNRTKIEYVVNLNDNASNYYTVLIFDRIKSIMPGYIAGNKVIFTNVPTGESAKIVSVGIQKEKPVLAVQAVQISQNTFTGLKFEEISPLAFKEEVKGFDK